MPKKGGTEDSSTIHFFQLKWGGVRAVVVKGGSGFVWRWGHIIILTINEHYKAVATVMCSLIITS